MTSQGPEHDDDDDQGASHSLEQAEAWLELATVELLRLHKYGIVARLAGSLATIAEVQIEAQRFERVRQIESPNGATKQ